MLKCMRTGSRVGGERQVVAVCSGANMDFDRLRFVSERADSSETLISATIPERPGAFQVRRYNIGILCFCYVFCLIMAYLPWNFERLFGCVFVVEVVCFVMGHGCVYG